MSIFGERVFVDFIEIEQYKNNYFFILCFVWLYVKYENIWIFYVYGIYNKFGCQLLNVIYK